MEVRFWSGIFLVFLFFGTTMAEQKKNKIVFLGDSLTAGYGLNQDQSYPALLDKKFQEENWIWEVVNAGVSGDTTRGGLARLSWVLRSKPQAVFIALGANDGLRGVDPKETEKNLEAIVSKLQEQKIKVLLAGMDLPTNMGEKYRKKFRSIFSAVAKKHNVPLYPFLLEGVAMQAELNQPDGIHPNAAGQKVMAQHIFKFLIKHLQ